MPAKAAAKLAGTQNPPQRTIRVALFGAEEMDFAREAFAAAHLAEAPRMVVIGESDIGADAAWSVQVPAGRRAPRLTDLDLHPRDALLQGPAGQLVGQLAVTVGGEPAAAVHGNLGPHRAQQPGQGEPQQPGLQVP